MDHYIVLRYFHPNVMKGTPDDIPDSNKEDGVYSLIPTSNCHLKSTSGRCMIYGPQFRSVVLIRVSPPSFVELFSILTTLQGSWKQISSRRYKICNSSPLRIMKAHQWMTPWGYGVDSILSSYRTPMRRSL